MKSRITPTDRKHVKRMLLRFAEQHPEMKVRVIQNGRHIRFEYKQGAKRYYMNMGDARPSEVACTLVEMHEPMLGKQKRK